LKRQMRREEKRQQLRGRDDWSLTEDDDMMDSGVGGLPFDIEHLRLQRCVCVWSWVSPSCAPIGPYFCCAFAYAWHFLVFPAVCLSFN